MADSPGQRLAMFRKSLGLNQRDFAARLGFSAGRVGSIESDAAPPSRGFLERIAKEFCVSSDWMLHGVGDMLHPAAPPASDFTIQTANGTLHIEAKRHAEHTEEFKLIPRMELCVSAGSGLTPVDNEMADALAFSATWLARNAINSQLAVLVRVKGDSMSPAIPNGALVLVHLAEKVLEHEGVYAFNRGEASFIKRLVPSAIDKSGRPASIAILADNPAYPPELISGPAMNEIRVVGRVRCVMTTL